MAIKCRKVIDGCRLIANRCHWGSLMDQSSKPRRSDTQSGPMECERIANLPFDVAEIAVLEIARLFFLAFHVPQRCSWVAAFDHGEIQFGRTTGPVIAKSVLDTITAVREVRRSGFNYCDPSCRTCSAFITPDECHLISALHNARRKGHASQSEAFQLCEGRDVSQFHSCIRALAKATQDVSSNLH